MKPECPPTTPDEMEQLLQNGHQRAETTNNASQSKATRTIHKSPNGAKTKQSTKDYEGQPEMVARPNLPEKTEEPQEQKSHEEILSVHIDDTKNPLTPLRLVVLKQQHYSTPTLHLVAYQNNSMIALAVRNHQRSLTQMPDQLL